MWAFFCGRKKNGKGTKRKKKLKISLPILFLGIVYEVGKKVNIDSLKASRMCVQAKVGETDALNLGLGGEPGNLMKMREAMKIKGGPPFGGMGFFDSTTISDDVKLDFPIVKMTKADVQKAKLDQFVSCASSLDSVYKWALQPIFTTDDRLTSVEILLRAKNGSDTAPYEDVLELVNPDADAETKEVYLAWKLAELIDWPLTILKAHPALQRLEGIFVNLRPLDLALDGALYVKVTERLNALVDKDKELYLRIAGAEATEDQMSPSNVKECYKAWRDLGNRLAYDRS